ncbi:MAG TPA: metallopeptidase TldD-related protein [Bryobacteraceae bacterium]|nr:metallopeptidase TldD-related protein [Bryobacteraceae bacterium]
MRILFVAGAAAAAAVLALCAETPPPDPILQAMRDEAARSVKLNLPDLDAPYFVQYLLDQSDSFTVSASLGALVARGRDRFRVPEIFVRVGDYKFDNTNFAGAGGGGSRYDLGSFPLDDDYNVLRRYLWLGTDSIYKSAVEAISRKRAAMRNINQSEQLDDFAKAVPVHLVEPFQKLAVDEKAWEDNTRSLSAVFLKYPDVKTSEVELHADNGGYYVVNSEGTEVRAPENVAFLRARATAQAPDGMPLHDTVTFHAFDVGHLPSEADMTRDLNQMAENLVAMAKAPVGEDYSGPVLFEGDAGPQIFAEILAKNLALSRAAVGARGGAPESEFEGRMGSRILPDSFQVVDDPTQKEWRGRQLFGSYDVDREGVVPLPLHLVEKGTLKGFLLTREPVRGFEGSNGRARLPGRSAGVADISNLFVTSSDTVPAADLKKKLIELIQARNKPYGIIVRKMDFPSTAGLGEVRRMLQNAQGEAHPVSMPLLVYKVFPDGHEEPVRGMRFRGFNARSLKDIVAAGDHATVFDFMDSTGPFALVGFAEYTTEACVIAPSIIIDDLELHPVDDEFPKLPVAPAPEFVK